MHNQIRPRCFLWMDRGAPKCLTHRGKYINRDDDFLRYSPIQNCNSHRKSFDSEEMASIYLFAYRELGYYNATSITAQKCKKKKRNGTLIVRELRHHLRASFDGSEWGPWRMWWRWFLHWRLCEYIIPWANNKLVMSASSNLFDDLTTCQPPTNSNHLQLRRICCAVCWVNPEMMKLKRDWRARGDRMDFSQRDWLN